MSDRATNWGRSPAGGSVSLTLETRVRSKSVEVGLEPPPVPVGRWSRSLWLAGLAEDVTPRAPLLGQHACDIAIVGAGFGGLWTAYYLKKADPSLRIVVLEAEIAGFGAAGRNGGWVSAGIAGSRAAYARSRGRDVVLRAEGETQTSVDEIGRVIAAEGIDCGFVKAGALTLATSRPQAERMRSQVAASREFGVSEADRRLLSAQECRALLSGAARVVAGTFTPHCARVDPARLVRGLADACERLGVRLYEQSRVQSYGHGEVRCADGVLRAELVVHATEAYRVEERHHGRDFLPVFSMMIATERLPESVWRELGWVDGLAVVDKHHLYYYAQRTPDGRIALGGRGAHHRLRQPLAPENERNPEVFRSLVRTLHDSFPATRGARLTHHWGGALAIPRDWCMRVSLERARKTGFVGGFGGHGVVAANIAGRTMRDLVLRRDTELVTLPWVGHRSRTWEPEPLPAIASRLIVKTLESADAHEDGHQRAARRVTFVAPFLPPY